MDTAKTVTGMSPERMRVAERATREPECRMLSLARLIDVPALVLQPRVCDRHPAVGVIYASDGSKGYPRRGSTSDAWSA